MVFYAPNRSTYKPKRHRINIHEKEVEDLESGKVIKICRALSPQPERNPHADMLGNLNILLKRKHLTGHAIFFKGDIMDVGEPWAQVDGKIIYLMDGLDQAVLVPGSPTTLPKDFVRYSATVVNSKILEDDGVFVCETTLEINAKSKNI